MAKNSSPVRSVRESIETPATRATGSSPVPALTPRAPATCAIVHRINASRGLLYADTPCIGLFSPCFEGSSFRELTPGSAPSPCFLAKLDKRATCQTLSRFLALQYRFRLASRHTLVRARPAALHCGRQNPESGPRESDNSRGPYQRAKRCLPRALHPSPR